MRIIASTIKLIGKRELYRLKSLKFLVRLGPYKEISDIDRNSFGKVLSVWCPDKGENCYILRWRITEWCNNKCSYCSQNHNRFARKGGRYTAHAFDNYSLQKWIDYFHKHFQDRRLSLVITGGEPMLDKKNMIPLLNELTSMPTTECIRIDTNATWKAVNYKEIDPIKIILMCTYHPSQVSKEFFIDHIKELLDFGYKIGMVNFVTTNENIEVFKEFQKEILELGVPLHPNPLWNSQGKYSEEALSLLRQELPEEDYHYRSEILSPHGKKCLFPALGYEMNQIGQIYVGCHPLSGSFFGDSLPTTFPGPVPCPKRSCVCLDMYSFLKEINRNTNENPLLIYSDILKNRH